MTVLIIDYGMSNLNSVKRAFEECGADVEVSDDPRSLKDASRVVLPGVGSFAKGSARLYERLAQRDSGASREYPVPLLGICLGMQLLAEVGTEGGDSKGLGLIGGRIERMQPPDSAPVRIPHVGWNEVNLAGEHSLFEGIQSGTDFYFVHSYRFKPTNDEDVLSTTPYCGGVVSTVGRANVFGTQFHPEKSSRGGLQLIRNFLKA